MERDIHAAQLERQQGRDPFDALDDASGQRSRQQLGGIERVGSARKCRIKRDFTFLQAAMLPAASVRWALTRTSSRAVVMQTAYGHGRVRP
jgi:hypothetical protein